MSLNVALVCPYSLDQPGGVATHVLGLAAWLRGRGYRTRVIAPGTGEPTDGQVLVGKSVSLRFNGSVANLAVRPTQSRKARAALAGADVVHVHEPLTPGIAYAAARAAAGRLVVTHHAHFRPGLLVGPARLRAALLPTRLTLAVSAAAADTARAVTGHTPVVVPNGVALPPSPAERKEKGLVLFVGRLDEPRKGYATFARLAEMVPEARFVAVGPGAGGAPRVEELGALSDEARDAWLSRAEVLVAPNRFGESFGLVLIEALARGCAVVASDLPAFRDVVSDPEIAGFFPVDDAFAAAVRLRARLESPCDPGAARRAVHQFSWNCVGPQVESTYLRLAKPWHA